MKEKIMIFTNQFWIIGLWIEFEEHRYSYFTEK